MTTSSQIESSIHINQLYPSAEPKNMIPGLLVQCPNCCNMVFPLCNNLLKVLSTKSYKLFEITKLLN